MFIHSYKKNILSRNGPAWSTWIRVQWASGHTQGCNGAAVGFNFTAWQFHRIFLGFWCPRPDQSIRNNYVPQLSYGIYLGGCHVEIDFRRVSCNDLGINALLPHRRQSFSTDSLFWRWTYGWTSFGTSFGQPLFTYSSTQLKVVLRFEANLISWKVSGSACVWPTLKMVTPFSPTVGSFEGRGSLDNLSAFPCSLECLKLIS